MAASPHALLQDLGSLHVPIIRLSSWPPDGLCQESTAFELEQQEGDAGYLLPLVLSEGVGKKILIF